MVIRRRAGLLATLALLLIPAVAAAATFEVGPGHDYETIGEVPWEALEAGDTVLIHWRAQPYHEKWIVAAHGTEDQPVTVQGVAGPDGQLPVIDGRDATTREELNYWGDSRSIIKIGGSNQPNIDRPTHIIIDGLEIAHAHQDYSFTGRSGLTDYTGHAAAIFVETGDHITIRNCVLRGSGNGLFVANQTTNILIEHNHLFDNGNDGSIYEHNSYTEADHITFQFNHFGPLCDGCRGNNLKDRSANTVIRYNWINGGNRTLDLVDSSSLHDREGYDETHVYGNVLIEPQSPGNRQIIHYGGDSSDENNYRKGTLYFHHNTVVSTREERTTLIRLSTNDERAVMTNNVVYVESGGQNLSYVDSSGILELSHNWFSETPVDTFSSLSGEIHDDGTNLFDDDPGFVDISAEDFHLREDSPLRNAAVHGDDAPTPEFQYIVHQGGEPRPHADPADIGAFGYCDESCQDPEPGGDAGPGGDIDAGSDIGLDSDTDPNVDAGFESDAGFEGDADPGTEDQGRCSLLSPGQPPMGTLLLFVAAWLMIRRGNPGSSRFARMLP